MSTTLEFLGFACLAAFAYAIWPAAAFIPAAMWLIMASLASDNVKLSDFIGRKSGDNESN